MALQYTTVSHRDISRGIDQKSVENHIPDGYAEDLLNVVTNSSGSLRKRRGYQGVSGYMPVRATAIDSDAGSITLTLPSTIDLTGVAARPVILAVRLSDSSYDNDVFDSTSTTWKYYDESKWSSASGQTLTLTDATATAQAEDSSAQISIWGLDVDLDVTDLDVYRREAESTLVGTRGGNLYKRDTAASNRANTTVDLSDDISGTVIVGPALFSAVPSTAPTRGYYTSSDVNGTGYAEVSSAEWVSGTTVRFTLLSPSRSDSGTPIAAGDYHSHRYGLHRTQWDTPNLSCRR